MWKNRPHRQPVLKFSSASPTGTRATASEQHRGINRGRNEPLRINTVTGQLPTILLRSPSGRQWRFLVDSGAGVNLVRRRPAGMKIYTDHETKQFAMGHSKFQTNEFTNFRIAGQSIKFYIVDETFPIIEDGIFGLPAMKQFNFSITNDHLKLNDTILTFQNQTIKPCERIHKLVYLEGKPTRVCFINCGESEKQITNNIENSNTYDQISTFKEMIRLSHIENSLKQPIEKLLLFYIDVFNLEKEFLPCTDLTKHTITLKENKIINTKSYKPPECHKAEISKQMNEMLEKGIIEPSDSPYNSPVWVVPKKLDASGKQKWRIVIDFRKLNELTDQDAYPLPDIDDILSQLGNAKFFSALDLSSGFHQIPMEEKSKKYTAFSTPQGHYHYNRMPFGLKNAPATFQRMMDTALRGLINKHCFVYLDDIIIFGQSIEEHNRNLAIVLQRLRELGLKLQPDKCEFLKPELEYLGHIVTSEGIKPNPKKLEAVQNFKIPKTPTDVKSFLGLAGYYRKFIRNFSKIAKPLTELTRKTVPFHWNEQTQTSFDTLKEKLCTAPVLKFPDFEKQFTLTTDASNLGIGAILSQDGHPCCYISRTLNPPERNYSTTEKELLAIVWATKRLRQYLLGRKFIIRTDHQALTWLQNCKDPSSRLIRWRLRLEEYEYEIQYTKGKDNTAADCLSRIHAITAQDEPTDLLSRYQTWETSDELPKPLKIVPNKKNFFQLTSDQLGAYEGKEKWLNILNKIIRNTNRIGIGDNDISIQDRNTIKRMLMFFNDTDKEIEFAWEPVKELTDDEIKQIIKENHELIGHPGIQKTYDRIKTNYKIPNLFKLIQEYIETCDTCQRAKLTRIRPREEPCISDTPIDSNEKIAMDLLGPLQKTKNGNQYILSIHDELTKYLILVPLKTQRTESIWDALLNHYIYVFSAPKKILTDRGQNFISELMQRYEEAFNIKHIKTTAFHPQSNGSLERTHAVVTDMLKSIQQTSTDEWDEQLNFICLAYNTMTHDATGYTPFELTFGHKANLPSTISKNPQRSYEDEVSFRKREWDSRLKRARDTLLKSKQRYQRDQRRKIIKPQSIFKEGDQVLIHNDHKEHKLDIEWLGPFTIDKVCTPYYVINDKKVHGNRLKSYFPGRQSSSRD